MITAQRDAYIQFQWLRFFDSFLIVKCSSVKLTNTPLLNDNRHEIFILKSHLYQEIFKAKFPTLASWILNIQFRMATA